MGPEAAVEEIRWDTCGSGSTQGPPDIFVEISWYNTWNREPSVYVRGLTCSVSRARVPVTTIE